MEARRRSRARVRMMSSNFCVVAASRQVLQNGVWVAGPVAAATVQKLEDIILTRARDLRRTAVGG